MATAPYLTQADLQARVGGVQLYLDLTDDDNNGVVDPAVETMIIAGVAGMAEGSVLRAGGGVPLADADYAYVKRYMLDVANYDLKKRRGKASEDDRLAYTDAVAFFSGLNNEVLPSAGGGTTTTANLDFTGYIQLMNRGRLQDL